MPAVQRVGDADGGGGVALAGIDSVRVNGRAIVVNGKPVSGHGRGPHAGPVTANGNGSVRAGGIPVVTTGCPDSCGHGRAGGSGDVRAG